MIVVRSLLCVLGVWLTAAVSGVAAQTMPRPARDNERVVASRDDALFELGLRFAFASPVGALGVEGHLHLQPWWTLNAGVGVGLTGPQGSLMTALHIKRPHSRLGIASGVSLGRFEYSRSFFERLFESIGHSSPPPTIVWSPAWWWNTELFIDLGSEPTVVRPFVGLGIPIAGHASECKDLRASDGIESCDADALRHAHLPMLLLLGFSLLVW